MPTTTTTMNVTAMTPELWANLIQVPLRKSLVAAAVADTQFEALLKYGDTVHQPYLEDTQSVAYTPGTPFTAQGVSAVQDTMRVRTFRIVPTYIDDIRELQSKYKYSMDIIEDQAYRLRDDIDTAVLLNVTGAGNFLCSAAAGTNVTATNTLATAVGNGVIQVAVSPTTAQVGPVQLFSRARRELRANNVTEAGDWIAVIDPSIAEVIERAGADKGFSVADATLRNGYAGNFLGFKIYISNNLPSNWIYMGKSKKIATVVQMPPRVRIKDVPNKLGVNIVTSIVFGTHVFNKNAQRFLGVHATAA